MKTKPLLLLAVILAAAALSGCTSANLARKLSDFEKLGVTEAEITGKFSHTGYKVEVKDGKRRAELEHSNAWLTKVRIVRETAEEAK